MDKLPQWTAFAGALVAVFLSAMLVPGLKAATPQNQDILMQVMGGTADLAAEKAYREADIYFHGGIKAGKPEVSPAREPGMPLMDMIRHLQDQTSPKQHRHLAGKEEKEILPWFLVAIRMNPHHIEAWRTGSYWFFRTGNPKRAMELASEGIRSSPKDYRLYLDRGILYHRLANWDKAISDFETADKLWKNINEDSPYERKAIRIYLKDSRERAKP